MHPVRFRRNFVLHLDDGDSLSELSKEQAGFTADETAADDNDTVADDAEIRVDRCCGLNRRQINTRNTRGDRCGACGNNDCVRLFICNVFACHFCIVFNINRHGLRHVDQMIFVAHQINF